MPLPIELMSGDVAKASEVMANFNYIMSIIGTLSTPGRTNTSTEFLLGARSNVLFTGTHDQGGFADRRFFQLGYNADYNYSPSQGVWKFNRFISGEAASALRLGDGYFSIWATSTTASGLNGVMTEVFKLKMTTGADYLYIPRSITIQGIDRPAERSNDYRLTYVPMETGVPIYDGEALSGPVGVAKKATDFGADKAAKAIQITCVAISDSGSDADLCFYKMESTPTLRNGGFQVPGIAGKETGGQGIVHLGTDEYAGEFYIYRSAPFHGVSAHVVGYWV